MGNNNKNNTGKGYYHRYSLIFKEKIDKDIVKQLAVGIYGSDSLPPIYEKNLNNINFFIETLIFLKGIKDKDYKFKNNNNVYSFKRKSDIDCIISSIDIYTFGGGMYLKGKYKNYSIKMLNPKVITKERKTKQ